MTLLIFEREKSGLQDGGQYVDLYDGRLTKVSI